MEELFVRYTCHVCKTSENVSLKYRLKAMLKWHRVALKGETVPLHFCKDECLSTYVNKVLNEKPKVKPYLREVKKDALH